MTLNIRNWNNQINAFFSSKCNPRFNEVNVYIGIKTAKYVKNMSMTNNVEEGMRP